MDFVPAIKSGFKNCFKFTGRASRSEYWFFYLFFVLSLMAVLMVSMLLGGLLRGAAPESTANDTGAAIMASVFAIAMLLYFLAMFFPILSLIVRRLHDSDKSAWFILLYFVPFGGIVMFVFFCLPGTRGPNQFGEDPLRTPATVANTFA